MECVFLPCMMSLGFIVSLRLFEILCNVTMRPPGLDVPPVVALAAEGGKEFSRKT